MVLKGLDILKQALPEENIQTSKLTQEMGAYQYINASDHDIIIEFSHDKSLIHFLFSLSGEIKLSSKASDDG